MKLACLLAVGCTPEQEVTTVRLDLAPCLVPADAAGCGEGLRARFAGEVGIPACLAVAGGAGAVAMPMWISPANGALSAAGGGPDSLPLAGASDTLRFKLFVLDEADLSRCTPEMFTPDRACDTRLPRCLMATAVVEATVSSGQTLGVVFGGPDQPCLLECNDRCRPGDPDCVSVCQRTAGHAVEACDGVDNDCDGDVDEGCDLDGDTFCGEGVPVAGEAGPCPDAPRDCDDGDPDRFPGATEVCDGADNDCDSRTDEPDDIQGAPLCQGAQQGACAGSVQRCKDGAWTECGAGEFGDDWDGLAEERCADEKDNDCDGTVDGDDEDCGCQALGVTRPCSVDVGACTQGAQVCEETEAGLRWGTCDGVVRVREACNGVDDDCDGDTDEDLIAGAGDACPATGVCAGRSRLCRDGAWRCAYPATWEPIEASCDGLDNDCDGETDEELSPPAGTDPCPVEGVCANGAARPVCDAVGGQWRCEYPPEGWEEVETTCDGLDNDCDGIADEDCACEPGQQVDCGSDEGACEKGVQQCESGLYGECRGPVHPQPETCNGADDDCDGHTDEGLTPPEEARCGRRGVCVDRATVCRDGEWLCDAPGYEAEEVTCDGLDNDCDGEVDETDAVVSPDVPICPPHGVCQGAGTRCEGGDWVCDYPETWEAAEVTCDGLDNDCDGATDEDGDDAGGGGLTPPDPSPCPPLVGVCEAARAVCRSGRWECDVPELYEAEEASCDEEDNDCDGDTDESPAGGPLFVPCYDGAPETDGVGLCHAGQHLCREGVIDVGVCVGQALPVDEVCNGFDDDCDDETDDLPPQQCGEGVCVGEAPGCVGGLVPPCEPHPELALNEELCDLLDNDCDGDTDELPPVTCGVGACYNEEPACIAGVVNDVCEPGDVTDEVCDGIDNDCNGDTDELADLTCGVGICARQVPACVGEAANVCTPGDPQDETCNGLDDDCSGDADLDEHGEAIVEDCYTAAPETEGVGLCRAGQATCNTDTGMPGPCEDEVIPAAELCNGLDDDCDDDLDDGPPSPALRTGPDGGTAELPVGVALGPGDFTIETWVRRERDGEGTVGHVLAQAKLDGTPSVALGVRNDPGAHVAMLEVVDDAGAETVATGVTDLGDGGWHHVAGQRHGGWLRLYVDGAQEAEAALAEGLDLSATDGVLFLGRRHERRGGSLEPFPGLIDEVRISHGVRYRGPFEPQERLTSDWATVDLWHLDEGDGDAAASAADRGHQLTVSGGGWAAEGLPVRTEVYEDGDGDGVGDAASALRACVPPEGYVAVAGDCDDGDDGVGLPGPEVLDNGADEDCDGRVDGDDGLMAMALDGEGAMLRVEGHIDFALVGMEITWDLWLWLARHSPAGFSPLVSNRRTVDDTNGYLFGIGGLAAADPARARRLVFLLDDADGEHAVVSDRPVPVGRWVHVAVTYHPETRMARLWLDGQPVGEEELVQLPRGSFIVKVGVDEPRPDDLLAGWLDDLRLSESLRWTEPFEPPVCPRADGDTAVLWRFEVEADEEETRDRSEGEWALKRVTLHGAERVATACEARTPPPANCRALLPSADTVCEDTPLTCRVRVQLGGASCSDWCGARGLVCQGAATVDATCGPGDPLGGGCAEGAAEAQCTCARP